MIDSVLIYKELSHSEFDRVTNSLSVTKLCNTNKIIKYKAKVKNLRIVVSPIHIIIKGSISKFYTNSYTSNLTRQSIEKAINKLENILGISLSNGLVYKIELSQFIYLSKPINEYIKLFEKYPYCKKKVYKTGVVFYNKRKSITIYDKKTLIEKTPKYKGIEIDSSLKYFTTIAKIEIKLKNKVKHQLKQLFLKQKKQDNANSFDSFTIGNALKVKDLYKEETYNFLYSYWLNSVLSIKINKKYIHSELYTEFISKVKNTSKSYR